MKIDLHSTLPLLLVFIGLLNGCGGDNGKAIRSSSSHSSYSSSPESYSSLSSSSVYSADVDHLRDYADFPIGVTVANSEIPEFNILSNLSEQTIVKRHFDQITSQNLMKAIRLHPTQNTYAFAEADAFVEFAKNNNITIHGNTSIWDEDGEMHEFMKNWPADDPDGFDAMLVDHATKVLTHFANQTHIVSWDIAIATSLFNEESSLPFFISEERTIARTLTIAREIVPHADLYIVMKDPSFGTETDYASWFISLLYYLKSENVPIDGITINRTKEVPGKGYESFWREISILKVIEWAVANGLKIRIANAHIHIDHSTLTKPEDFVGTLEDYALTLEQEGYCSLVKQYRDMVPSHLQGGMSLLSVTDRSTQLKYRLPALFDENYIDKPTLRTFAEVLMGAECLPNKRVYSAGVDHLRDYADFPIGVGVANSDLPEFNILTNTSEQSIVEQHFDELTSFSIMNGEKLHPAPNIYNFAEADKFVDYAAQHALRIHGNALITANSGHEFLKDFPDDDPNGFLALIDEHVTTIVSHFAGNSNVVSWDVVEGVSNTDFTYSTFYKKSGNSTAYIERAFLAARSAAPNADLYVVMTDAASDSGSYYTSRFTALLTELRNKNIPIDGINIVRVKNIYTGSGMGDFWRERNFKWVVEWAVKNSLKVRLTHLRTNTDVTDFSSPEHALIEQKSGYCSIVKQYLDMVPAHLRGGISISATNDGVNSEPLNNSKMLPTIFDENYQGKPALHGLFEVLTGNMCSMYFDVN